MRALCILAVLAAGLSCLVGAAEVGEADDRALLTRSYQIHGDTFGRLRRTALAAVAAKGEEEGRKIPEIGERQTEEGLRSAFACLGVTWPKGSSTTIVKRNGELFLVVVNNGENLRITEKTVAEITMPPRQFRIDARIVEHDGEGKLAVLAAPQFSTVEGKKVIAQMGKKQFFPNGRKAVGKDEQAGETITDGVSMEVTPEPCEAGIRLVGRVIISDTLDVQDLKDYNEAPSASYTVRQTVLPFAVVAPHAGGYISIPMAKRKGKQPELELTVSPLVRRGKEPLPPRK